VAIASATFNQNTGTNEGGNLLSTNPSGDTEVRNTIFAGGTSPAGPNCRIDNGGSFTDLGHNLDSGTTCGLTGSGSLSSTDPNLGALGNNGGATKTEALPSTSSAVDVGDTAANCPATDQRALTRPDDSETHCDIGAFEYQEYTLSVTDAGTGSGTVTSSPSAISCPGTCSHQFTAGSPVTLTATPTSGSTFTGWNGGGCTGTSTCMVTMSSDQSVTATFTANPPPHTLTVIASGASGTGTVTSSPAGISCPSSCSHSFPSGTQVTLTATPTSGNSFVGWSGGGCSGTGTCTVTMSADQTVHAMFVGPGTRSSPPPTCTLTASSSVAVAHDVASATRKHKKKKAKKPKGVLTLTVRCDQAARVTITGTLNELIKMKTSRKHHRSTATGVAFRLGPVSASAKARTTLTITLKLPSAAIAGLRKKRKESVTLALTAKNANGSGKAAATIRALKPAH
jgi:hypothetical protein